MTTPDALEASADTRQRTDGLRGFVRFAVPLLGWWNTSPVTQRVVVGFARQVSQRWILGATANRLQVVHGERVDTLDPPRGVLLVGNHRTFWDMYVTTAVIGARTGFVRRLYFPVRSRFFYTNPLGVGINLAMAGGAMWPPMFDGFDRHGRNSAAIAAVTHGLDERGTLVGIHPEGTRNKGSDPQVLLRGRGGAGRMVQAVHPDVIVLPFHLSGLTGHLPRELVRNFLPAGRRGPPIRLVFGEPVRAGDLDRSASPRDLSEALLDRVRALGAERSEH